MSSGPVVPFLALLGSRVRARRKQQELTVAQLAERSGISRRMLTQIELGQANPSLVTVDKVARALDTDFAGVVLAQEPVDLVSVLPAGTATLMWSSDVGCTAWLHVATSDRGGPELWTWSLAAGDRYTAQPDPAGSQELFLVQSGTLTLHGAGFQPVAVPAGGSARLASDRHYAYVNEGPCSTAFVRVVHIRASAR